MQSTIANRTIYCRDNLDILQGINTGSIHLIYLDPPFNKKKTFTAPLGTSAQGASFRDIFTQEDVKEEWIQTIKEDHENVSIFLESAKQIEGRTSYNFCYLAYMAIRLLECHRILKDTGSIYLHCDPTMSHYLKLLLDCIFGESNFRNEIVWCYGGRGMATKWFNRKHDIILAYSKQDEYFFNDLNARRPINKKDIHRYNKIDEQGRRYARVKNANGNYSNIFLKEEGVVWEDYWHIPFVRGKNYSGYPTQKPIKLIERIIEASSSPGDIVLDPFCGCATTCVAAEKLRRRWIGIDISVKAYELVQTRIKDEVYEEGLLKSEDGALPQIHFSTDPPARTDQGEHPVVQKYVYIISHPHYKGEYKVGIASNVKSRLNSYQIGDPDRQYTLEYSFLTPYYRQIEHSIHTLFEHKHEWVIAHFEDIKKAIETYQPPNKLPRDT